MKLPSKLPERVSPGGASNSSLDNSYIDTKAEVINQLIDYLEEKQQLDNEYARGFNDGAYEQRTLEKTRTDSDNSTPYARGYKQGKFDAEMDRQNKTITPEGMAQAKPLVINQTITLPKPEWWEDNFYTQTDKNAYLEALEAASKASEILFKLGD